MTKSYKLRNGHSVATRIVDDERTEFETRNAQGETISTVTLGRESAREVFIGLRAAAGR